MLALHGKKQPELQSSWNICKNLCEENAIDVFVNTYTVSGKNGPLNMSK